MVNDSYVYLRVKLSIAKGILDEDIDHRLRKFNTATFNIIMDSKELSEAIKSKLIVKKFLPILLNGMDSSLNSEVDCY